MVSIRLEDLKKELSLTKNTLILDFRPHDQFDEGFIAGSQRGVDKVAANKTSAAGHQNRHAGLLGSLALTFTLRR